MSEGRSVWRTLFSTIIKSFRLFPSKGRLMGEDALGNKYYESPSNKHSMKKSPPRWFEPKNGEWQQDLPAEWEAWLRGRRKDAPTIEEIQKNLDVSSMKKEKGSKITIIDKTKEKDSLGGFPIREDFEREPGKYRD